RLAVRDPCGAHVLDPGGDVLGPGPFAGVRHAAEPGPRGLAEHPCEPLDAGALTSRAVQGHDAAAGVAHGDLERALRVVEAVVADDVGTELHVYAVITFTCGESVEHGLDRAEPVTVQPPRVIAGTEYRLRVRDTGRREVCKQLDREPAEVVERGEQLAELEVVVDEVERPAERPAIGTHAVGERGPVAIGELPQGRGPGAPLDVEMQLHLGEGTQVSHLPMVAVPGWSVDRPSRLRQRLRSAHAPK